ncbi:dihydropteroate synthase [Chloroflexota bacterium]
MLIIGEKINATLKSARKAIEERDTGFLQGLARSQWEAGANYIDVNVSTDKGADFDKESMEWAVEKVQEVVDVPLSIDSPDPKIIEVGLRKAKGKSMINSVTAEPDRLEAIFPLAKEFDSEVISLAMMGAIASEAGGRLEACEKIAESARKYGVGLEKLYFDPLTLSVATDTSQGIVTLDTLKGIKARFSEAKTTMGLSNVSFGLPGRSLINRSFLLLAIYAGLDSAILDPRDKKLTSVIKAGEMLLGRDNHCLNYIKAFKAEQIEL